MFTGIINDIGTVVDLNEDILTVSFNNSIYTNLDPGTSIAIDGCCLTLKEYKNENLVFQVSNETFTRTALRLTSSLASALVDAKPSLYTKLSSLASKKSKRLVPVSPF